MEERKLKQLKALEREVNALRRGEACVGRLVLPKALWSSNRLGELSPGTSLAAHHVSMVLPPGQ